MTEVTDKIREPADAIEELVEALKPFAKLHVDDGDYSDTDVSTYEDNTVRAADVRRARALVASIARDA